MTIECGFCKGTKIEPGFTECVWCDNTGRDGGIQPDALKKALAKRFTKGDTDPSGDCDKFEAGINVGAWFQRIVVYGDSPADAEALRDEILAALGSNAALRGELADRKAKHLRSCQLAIGKSQLAKQRHAEVIDLQQRLTAADEQAEKQRRLKMILSERVQNAEANCSVFRHEAAVMEQRIAQLEALLLQSNELFYAIQDDLGAVMASAVGVMRGKVFTALKEKPAKPEANPVCKTCNGTHILSDGALYCSAGGIPYENGPIECVKDCPDCTPAAQTHGEPVAQAQGVGVLTFMRDDKAHAGCACCPGGDHVFCRYFKGLPDFNDLTQDLRFRSDLEGREFRVTVEALPIFAVADGKARDV